MCLKYVFLLFLKTRVSWGRTYHIWYNVPVGNLKVFRSKFGCGWVVGGCHKHLKVSPLQFFPEAASARVARVTVIADVATSVLSLAAPDPVSQFEKAVAPLLTPDKKEELQG